MRIFLVALALLAFSQVNANECKEMSDDGGMEIHTSVPIKTNDGKIVCIVKTHNIGTGDVYYQHEIAFSNSPPKDLKRRGAEIGLMYPIISMYVTQNKGMGFFVRKFSRDYDSQLMTAGISHLKLKGFVRIGGGLLKDVISPDGKKEIIGKLVIDAMSSSSAGLVLRAMVEHDSPIGIRILDVNQYEEDLYYFGVMNNLIQNSEEYRLHESEINAISEFFVVIRDHLDEMIPDDK